MKNQNFTRSSEVAQAIDDDREADWLEKDWDKNLTRESPQKMCDSSDGLLSDMRKKTRMREKRKELTI